MYKKHLGTYSVRSTTVTRFLIAETTSAARVMCSESKVRWHQRTIVCVSKTCWKNDKRLLSDQEHWSCYLQTLEVGGNDWIVDNILFSAVQLWNDFGATLVVVLLVYVLKAGTKNFSSNNMFSNAPWWARNCTERITFKSKLCWFNHNFNSKSHW